MIHSLLVCSDVRDHCLKYIAALLQRNSKKAQLQVIDVACNAIVIVIVII